MVYSAKPRSLHHLVQLVEQQRFTPGQRAAKPELRYRVAGETQRDEHRGNRVGEDQYAVLRDLGVGDALHAAHDSVEKHDGHADRQPEVVVHLQKAGERHADPLHLPDDIGHRRHNEADYGHDARRPAVVAIADEFRDGEFAELAQVRREQHGKQHIAAGPAHQEHRSSIAHEGDESGHGNEGGSRHPVGSGRHAVGNRMNGAARHVELACGAARAQMAMPMYSANVAPTTR